MSYPKLKLAKNQERRLLAGHAWIYSNEVDTTATPLKSFAPGSLVKIEAASGRLLGVGYLNPKTLLCARILSRDPNTLIDLSFFMTAIHAALHLRERIFSEPFYRLIYGESDGLPGVIVDRFDDVLVGQINTAGMQALAPLLTEALLAIVKPRHLLWRNESAYRLLEGLPQETSVAYGEPPALGQVRENGCAFEVDFRQGQKTGWFYDHRLSREHLTTYVKDKTVLDVFSYLGAFALPAAKAGAKEVLCIDISETATTQILKNAKLNQLEDKISIMTADAFAAMENLLAEGRRFEVIILDPPAFIKRQKDLEAGSIAYLRANQLALSLLAPQGILLSASCSMHLSRDALLNIIRRAGLKTQKNLKILEQLHQGPDHPIHPSIEETNYLKGFIVSV